MAREMIPRCALAPLALGLALTMPVPAQAQVYEDNLRTARATMQAAASQPLGTPRTSARSSPRIVGGEVVQRTEEHGTYGHAVSIQFDGEHFCGGSFLMPVFGLIGGSTPFIGDWASEATEVPRMVVTAAHCVFEADGRLTDPEFLTVRSESLNLNDAGATVQQVLAIEPHPDYDDFNNHDIAVLILEPAPVRRGSSAALGLPTLADALGYQVATVPLRVNGWGAMAEGGPMSADLRKVRIPYADQLDCSDLHARVGVDIPAGVFCAGFRTGGFDSCQGDSGGGVVFQPRSADGTPRGAGLLVGVVSWGIGCARYGLQGVYTDVLSYASWLEFTALRYFEFLD